MSPLVEIFHWLNNCFPANPENNQYCLLCKTGLLSRENRGAKLAVIHRWTMRSTSLWWTLTWASVVQRVDTQTDPEQSVNVTLWIVLGCKSTEQVSVFFFFFFFYLYFFFFFSGGAVVIAVPQEAGAAVSILRTSQVSCRRASATSLHMYVSPVALVQRLSTPLF